MTRFPHQSINIGENAIGMDLHSQQRATLASTSSAITEERLVAQERTNYPHENVSHTEGSHSDGKTKTFPFRSRLVRTGDIKKEAEAPYVQCRLSPKLRTFDITKGTEPKIIQAETRTEYTARTE